MSTIKAPFNFVPLSDKVYFPGWADQISHDIPFSDGLSGVIDLKITAETPIFVRNGHTSDDANAKNPDYKSFSKIGNQYFIPGTSIKGAIRSVLEIMSFGKMSRVEDSSFGLRDLRIQSYRETMRNIQCGWLQETHDGYVLYDWGEPGRISVENIDKKFKTNLAQFVKGDNFRDDYNKTAKYKYIQAKSTDALLESCFEEDTELQEAKRKLNPIEPRKFYKFGGSRKGVLVFTGQPSQRKQIEDKRTGKLKWTGKFYEFVFLKPDSEQKLILSDELVKQFKTIHTESPDYKEFWLPKLKHGERVPVFFKKIGNTIHSIGLAYMYKYPFAKSVFDAIPRDMKNPDKKNKDEFRLDMADCIFGYSFYDKSLKGRVQFGNAFAVGNPVPLTDKVFISSSPHASYYPLYTEGGRDWNSVKKISGWKRYPTRNTLYSDNLGTSNMESVASMLNKGVIFKERIHFHNLRPIELGCLLSAITFHGYNDVCFHNIGYGKAFGYGKIKISDVKLEYVDSDMYSYMFEYEKEMGCFASSMENVVYDNSPFSVLKDKSHNNKWLASEQLLELFSMAAGIPSGKESIFRYMKMSTNRNANEFISAKNNGEHLDNFTVLSERSFVFSSISERRCTNTERPNLSHETPLTEIAPTNLKVGDEVMSKCVGRKKVRIENIDYDIQLVVPRNTDPDTLINREINVIIKQISRAGKICQVDFKKEG